MKIGDQVFVTVPSIFHDRHGNKSPKSLYEADEHGRPVPVPGCVTFTGKVAKLDDGRGRVLVDFGKRRKGGVVVLQPIPPELLKVT